MIGQLVSLRAASLAVAVGAAIVIVPAVPAMASGGCSGSRITINSNPGAEPPSIRTGHRHLTGNHYIRSVRPIDGGKLVVWWADNNGGLDGDTADTFYTNTFC